MARIQLGINEERSIPVQGQFLFLRRADGQVAVTVERNDGMISSYPMGAREQIEFPGGMKSLKIRNISGVQNDVVIMTGWGRFVPFNDGTVVTIAGQVEPLSVEFENPPAVTINGGVSTEITDPVEVFSNPLSPLSVQFEATPAVAVAGTVSAEITDPVEVFSNPLSPLSVQFEAPQAVTVGGTVSTAPQVPGGSLAGVSVQPDTTGHTVAANAARKALILKARAANTDPVTYSGIDLDPGERVEIVTTAAVELIAANAADAVQILEVA